MRARGTAAARVALGLALLLGTSAAPAQQRDSVARRDSALAERERGRIRAERARTRRPPTSDSAAAAPAAPRRRRPTWRGELATGTGAHYSRDPASVDVTSPGQLLLGAAAVWPLSERTALSATTRVSLGSLHMESRTGADDWSGGTVMHADLLGVLEWAPRTWGTLRGGAGLAWLHGPSDVAPFRFNNGTPLHAAALLGASARVMRSRPLHGFLDVHGIRYGGATVDDPIREPGTVTRYLLGIRYGH